jgi:hypothetical protein
MLDWIFRCAHDGVIRLERSVPSEVADIIRCLAEFGEAIGKIGFEAGVLSRHFWARFARSCPRRSAAGIRIGEIGRSS